MYLFVFIYLYSPNKRSFRGPDGVVRGPASLWRPKSAHGNWLPLSPALSPDYFSLGRPPESCAQVDLFSPALSPVLSPALRPVLSPALSPVLSPALSPVLSPVLSPALSPVLSPALSPVLSPAWSPAWSPA